MIDYGKEYNGHQVAKKIRTEDAGGGRADKAGSLTQESERGSGGRTSNLFSADRVTHGKSSVSCSLKPSDSAPLC